jgi:hypothetical protein
LCVSRNHHNLEWVGERRLKNAVMLLEWIPSVSKLQPLPSKASSLSDAQERRLRNALALLNLDSSGTFNAHDLREALRSAEDLQLTDAEIDDLLGAGAATAGAPLGLSFEQLHEILTSGRYRQIENGRYYVLLSLAEAETMCASRHHPQPQAEPHAPYHRTRLTTAHTAPP